MQRMVAGLLVICLLGSLTVLAEEKATAEKAVKKEALHSDAWDAAWILPADPGAVDRARFIKEFSLSQLPYLANVVVAAEAYASVYVNGQLVGKTSSWSIPKSFIVSSLLHLGVNRLEVDVARVAANPATMCELVLWDNPTVFHKVVTDLSWSVSVGGKTGGCRIAPFVTPQAGPVWGPLRYVYGGPLPEVKVKKITHPTALAHGSPFEAVLEFTGDPVAYGAKEVELGFIRNGKAIRKFTGTHVDGNQWSFRIPSVSEWMPTGDYQVAWRRVRSSEEWVAAGMLSVSGEIHPRSHAEIKEYKGRPTLLLNGTPLPFLGAVSRCPTWFDDEPRAFGASGIHLKIVDGTDFSEDQKYNSFAGLDENVYATLNADPEAWLILKPNLGTPSWWLEKHPNDLIEFADPLPPNERGRHPGRRRWNVSLASTAYRADTDRFLRAMVAHVQTQPYRRRVLGVQLAGGTTSEWLHWGSTSPMPMFSDYSPSMRKELQVYLREKYGNDMQKLRAAWHDPAVTFETAAPPSKETWLAPSDDHPFRVNPQIVDYATVHNDVVVDTISTFAKAVRQASNNDWIVGVYYGYTLYLPRHTYLMMTGHLAMKRLLADPNIQYISSPQNYYMRAPGGDAMPMYCAESVRLHGKMAVLEADIRTHLALDSQEGPDCRCMTPEQTVQVIRRDAALALIRGFGMYWYSVGQPTRAWFVDDITQQVCAQVYKMSSEWNHEEFRNSARVAVIVDEESAKYLTQPFNVLKPLLNEQVQTQMNRVGIPWDCYLASDLAAIARNYDVFIFANLFHASDTMKATISKRLKRAGKTLIWCYAPGAAVAENVKQEMLDLTGLALSPRSENASKKIHIEGTDITVDWPEELQPVISFHATDPDVEILERYANGEAAIVRKRLGKWNRKWNSIFVGALNLPPAGWRKVLLAAGQKPIMDTDDVVYFRDPWLCVHTTSGGPKTAELPSGWTRVTELFESQPYKIKEGMLRWTAEPLHTYLFRNTSFMAK